MDQRDSDLTFFRWAFPSLLDLYFKSHFPVLRKRKNPVKNRLDIFSRCLTEYQIKSMMDVSESKVNLRLCNTSICKQPYI